MRVADRERPAGLARAGGAGEEAGARPVEAARVRRVGRAEVELEVGLALRGGRHRQVVEELAGELARHDDELLARVPVDHADVHARSTDALAQLRGEIPLDLLARELPDARQEWAHLEPRAGLLQERVAHQTPVARIPLAHLHLGGAPAGARRGHRELLADGPEREQPDPELAPAA